MNRTLILIAAAALAPAAVHAFCGFYVSKADTKLFNKPSKVVLVREDDKTVMTMANDFEGDAKDFAVVIPVPTFIEKGQIHVGDNALIEHLDAYSAPRLVEYFDDEFADFYKAMFTEQVKKEDMRCVFTEYAWDMGWCDPCAAEPLSNEELPKLGVFWLEGGSRNSKARPMNSDVFITRLPQVGHCSGMP